MLLILHPEDKLRTTEDMDSIVSAEIPDPNLYPLAYETVMKCMVHGPCGELNPMSPCMKDGKCTKGYPKEFIAETQVASDGYPRYRRRNDGRHITIER